MAHKVSLERKNDEAVDIGCISYHIGGMFIANAGTGDALIMDG
jgi:hypothetical protein